MSVELTVRQRLTGKYEERLLVVRYILSEDSETYSMPGKILQLSEKIKKTVSNIADGQKGSELNVSEIADKIMVLDDAVCGAEVSLDLNESSDISGNIKIRKTWHRVYIGMGSNMGDRYRNLKTAEEIISGSEKFRKSSLSDIYETDPYGYEEQDKFLNCVMETETVLEPEPLIDFLLEAEKALKRERTLRWGPRTIDLDVIFYDRIITDNPRIIVPHPEMHKRVFVLKPMCDLNPEYFHPVLRERCDAILKNIEHENQGIRIWKSSRGL